MKITKEDFETWRDNPVTEEVFRAFDRLAERAKAEWLSMSWDKGQCDPVVRADLKARAEVVQDFREMTHEDLEAWLNDESKG